MSKKSISINKWAAEKGFTPSVARKYARRLNSGKKEGNVRTIHPDSPDARQLEKAILQGLHTAKKTKSRYHTGGLIEITTKYYGVRMFQIDSRFYVVAEKDGKYYTVYPGDIRENSGVLSGAKTATGIKRVALPRSKQAIYYWLKNR